MPCLPAGRLTILLLRLLTCTALPLLPHTHVRTWGGAAFFSFGQLCGAAGLKAGMDDGGALAAPDFLALCRHFK